MRPIGTRKLAYLQNTCISIPLETNSIDISNQKEVLTWMQNEHKKSQLHQAW